MACYLDSYKTSTEGSVHVAKTDRVKKQEQQRFKSLQKNSLFPDHEARRDTVDGLDEVHTIPAVGEQVVDVHILDVERVDPHAKHTLLSVVRGIKQGELEDRKKD